MTNVFGSDEVSKTAYIIVDGSQNPPTADFTADNMSGEAPLTVTFTNQSSGAVDSCLWEFGDGQTSSNCADPFHIYQSAGLYNVSLTVNNSFGSDKETKMDYIKVKGRIEDLSYSFLPFVQ